MAFHNGPEKSIVGRGLIFCHDVGDRGSYIGSGTTFKDLISGVTATATVTYTPLSSTNNLGPFLTGDALVNYSTFTALGNNKRTLAGWCKGTTNDRIPFSLGGNANGANQSFAISCNNAGVALYGKVGAYDEGISASVSFRDGTWRYIAVTWDAGDPGVLKLYRDGILEGTTTRGAGEAYNTSNGVTIHRWMNQDRNWAGDTGPVHVYDRDLTASELLQNYNAQRGRFGV